MKRGIVWAMSQNLLRLDGVPRRLSPRLSTQKPSTVTRGKRKAPREGTP